MFKQLSILSKLSEDNKDNESVAEKQQEQAKTENVEERVNIFNQKNKPEQTRNAHIEENPLYSEAVTNSNPRLRIYKPTHYDIVKSIGTDIVRDQKIVILDMTNLDEKTSIKIIQFVSGICFALNIEPEEVGPKIISIDPLNKARNFS